MDLLLLKIDSTFRGLRVTNPWKSSAAWSNDNVDGTASNNSKTANS